MTRPSAEAEAICQRFAQAGAQVVDPPLLQPADTLLDLYGEDIRARAYVTSDALRGEQMLRPDFTVPVALMHLTHGTEPARYTYAGPVFRRQEDDPDRANEYLQVGFELFDRTDPAAADAEVFALIADVVSPLALRASTGDIGILLAAVRGLHTTDMRKQALLRHVWRPNRFRALLERFSGRTPPSAAHARVLAGERSGAPAIGLRGPAEVEARIAALATDAAQPPMAATEVELVETLLDVRETLPFAIAQLSNLSVDMPAIAPALDGMKRRTDALAGLGVDIDALAFEASYGRTSMEYYDGFVFGFHAAGRADLPPVATGGRYDALTRRLGNGREVPAVGGVVRPEVMQELAA